MLSSPFMLYSYLSFSLFLLLALLFFYILLLCLHFLCSFSFLSVVLKVIHSVLLYWLAIYFIEIFIVEYFRHTKNIYNVHISYKNNEINTHITITQIKKERLSTTQLKPSVNHFLLSLPEIITILNFYNHIYLALLKILYVYHTYIYTFYMFVNLSRVILCIFFCNLLFHLYIMHYIYEVYLG